MTTADHTTAAGIRQRPRLRAWTRGVLAGPLAFVASWILMAGAALYLPEGAAGIDNLVFPVVLLPWMWAVLCVYGLRGRRLLRAYGGIGVGLASHGGLIAAHLGSVA